MYSVGIKRTFNVIPIKFNALSNPSLPRFYALLEGFFWAAPQLRH